MNLQRYEIYLDNREQIYATLWRKCILMPAVGTDIK